MILYYCITIVFIIIIILIWRKNTYTNFFLCSLSSKLLPSSFPDFFKRVKFDGFFLSNSSAIFRCRKFSRKKFLFLFGKNVLKTNLHFRETPNLPICTKLCALHLNNTYLHKWLMHKVGSLDNLYHENGTSLSIFVSDINCPWCKKIIKNEVKRNHF